MRTSAIAWPTRATVTALPTVLQVSRWACLYARYGRDLSSRQARRIPLAQPRAEQPVSQNKHRPKSRPAHLEWPPAAHSGLGPEDGSEQRATAAADVGRQDASGDGLPRLPGNHPAGAEYSSARMEVAAERAVMTGAISHKRVKSILRNGLDSQPRAIPPASRPSLEHENLRGRSISRNGESRRFLNRHWKN